MALSIREIAKLAGVSSATVSRVIGVGASRSTVAVPRAHRGRPRVRPLSTSRGTALWKSRGEVP